MREQKRSLKVPHSLLSGLWQKQNTKAVKINIFPVRGRWAIIQSNSFSGQCCQISMCTLSRPSQRSWLADWKMWEAEVSLRLHPSHHLAAHRLWLREIQQVSCCFWLHFPVCEVKGSVSPPQQAMTRAEDYVTRKSAFWLLKKRSSSGDWRVGRWLFAAPKHSRALTRFGATPDVASKMSLETKIILPFSSDHFPPTEHIRVK